MNGIMFLLGLLLVSVCCFQALSDPQKVQDFWMCSPLGCFAG